AFYILVALVAACCCCYCYLSRCCWSACEEGIILCSRVHCEAWVVCEYEDSRSSFVATWHERDISHATRHLSSSRPFFGCSWELWVAVRPTLVFDWIVLYVFEMLVGVL
ncbi:unnamed protein product, partial [Ectocarpus sp. 12 AP-2014]